MPRRFWVALRQAHLWLGWMVAAWLLLAAATGSALLFVPQLKALAAPACPVGAAQAPSEALATIDAAFPGRVRMTTLASPELCFHEVSLRNGGGAYVDPTSLRVVRSWERSRRLTDLLLDLHRQLLLQDVGKLLVALLATAALILVAAGFTLALRRPKRLSLRLWPRAATPADLLASHRNLGVVLAAPLAFMAASGLVMSYPKEARSLIAAAIGEPAPPRPQPSPSPGDRGRPHDWTAMIAAVEAAAPGRPIRSVTWPERPDAPVAIHLRSEHAEQTLRVSAAGRVSASRPERGDDRAGRIVRSLHNLHAGRAPPLAGSVALLAVALLLAAAAVAGVGSYAIRRAWGWRAAHLGPERDPQHSNRSHPAR